MAGSSGLRLAKPQLGQEYEVVSCLQSTRGPLLRSEVGVGVPGYSLVLHAFSTLVLSGSPWLSRHGHVVAVHSGGIPIVVCRMCVRRACTTSIGSASASERVAATSPRGFARTPASLASRPIRIGWLRFGRLRSAGLRCGALPAFSAAGFRCVGEKDGCCRMTDVTARGCNLPHGLRVASLGALSGSENCVLGTFDSWDFASTRCRGFPSPDFTVSRKVCHTCIGSPRPITDFPARSIATAVQRPPFIAEVAV